MFKTLFFSLFITLVSSQAFAASEIKCQSFNNEGLSYYTATASGYFEMIDENTVQGELDLKLIYQRVQKGPRITKIDKMIFTGELVEEAGRRSLHIKGRNTSEPNYIEYIVLTADPEGETRTLPNGGFVRTSDGYYRPQYCEMF